MLNMSEYEAKMIGLEKIEIKRKLFNDLYTNGLITEEEYESTIRELYRKVSCI